MGLRETLNENPRIATGVTVGIIVITLIMLIRMSGGGTTAQTADNSGKVFFSVDDGATWFPDDATKVPPFQHEGKEAVLARVYRCGGKPFVNHLERFTPEGKKKAEEIYSKKLWKSDPTALEAARQAGMEVKLPGKGTWVKLSNMEKAQEIMRPKCPGGESIDTLEIVNP